jgi:prepilin-type N-terminal cleavage/methylation domain-containing protein
MRTAERGFSLIELLVCVGILAIASAASVGAFAALARNATPGTARDLALMVAENALTRSRAAAAYASSPSLDGPALLSDRSWALHPGEADYVAGAELSASAICNANGAKLLQLPVAVSYDAASQRVQVVVTYPHDPCRAAADGTIPSDDAQTLTLAETLPPPVYPPGQVVHHDVLPPARM